MQLGLPLVSDAFANVPASHRGATWLVAPAGQNLPVSHGVHALVPPRDTHALGHCWHSLDVTFSKVPASQPGEKCASIGIPVPGLDLCIFDPDQPGRDLPQGETGEIAVRGPNVTAGYWNRADLAGTTHVGEWFLTGDIGYIDEEGLVFLVDRKKDLILSGGFNVYPLMIEKAIHEHPDVAEAMVIGIPDAYRGESAKAFVVLRPGAEPFTLEDLQAFLASRLGRHEIPRALAFRSDLPRTKVGKGDRRALRAEEEAARAAS